MSPAGLVWPRLGVLRALWTLLVVLLAPWRVWAVIKDVHQCNWKVVLNQFEKVGNFSGSDRFFDQAPLESVDLLFTLLVNAPLHSDEKYLGFPYYLKINYTCEGSTPDALVRHGHLTGLKPLVLVTFQSPVNFRHWKTEQLQIQMEAAPFHSTKPCKSEDMCVMSWYTPMPIKNGSVVMHVDISGNGIGLLIPNKRFQVNINGFLKRNQDGNGTLGFTVGNEIFQLEPRYFMNSSSRPLWYTINQSPVLILGGIPEEKSILLTDNGFSDISLVELSIDSCWVGSFYCPQTSFTATIYDTIATESTLFIRQNQLVYYFTGTYTTLHESNHGSDKWVRVLANECIKKLCPVYFHTNGTEYIMALSTGNHEGYIHFGAITEGYVSFRMMPTQQSVCQEMAVANCSIIWATYVHKDSKLLLLVEVHKEGTAPVFQVINYYITSDTVSIFYTIPSFIPNDFDRKFIILGPGSYTNFPMIPKGMFYNAYNHLLFIWGNFLLMSYDNENFIYLTDFPKEQSIKYIVNSFQGDMALVTETEEIWYLLEGTYEVYKLFPSRGWDVHVHLQVMRFSSLYAPKENMLTLFYEDRKLYQLMYLMNKQRGWLVKRQVPVNQLLMYQQINGLKSVVDQGGYRKLFFANFCPFTMVSLGNLPNPQRYTRLEHYRAQPPRALEPLGFHNQNSLTVYQGLVYHLLWVHTKYDQPYADQKHDSTWHWWKDKKNYKDYYFYQASNKERPSKVHIDMVSYEKIYNLQAYNTLPKQIFLDKGTSYSFSALLTTSKVNIFSAAGTSLGMVVVLADPNCVEAEVKQLVSHNSVLFWITFTDKRMCFDQGISGHHLMKTSLLLRVIGSSGKCFQSTYMGTHMQGNVMMPILIGCPPGKRLAFDISYTLEYNRQVNKNYFDCVNADPEMPCFLFRDIFYPFFLIQDMVTGDSGSFRGSYVLKVIGGGTTLDTIRDYSQEEIYRFNSPLDTNKSLIWTTTKNISTSEDMAFNIMSHQSSGIRWLCMENSPCYDTIPHSIFAPDFFFKILVSNKGVDKSTYCDYQLVFLLHIHGFPLSAERALFIFLVSTSIFVGLLILFIIYTCILLPFMVKAWDVIRWKINNIITSESYYTYASSSKTFDVASKSRSRTSHMNNPPIISKMLEQNHYEAETIMKK